MIRLLALLVAGTSLLAAPLALVAQEEPVPQDDPPPVLATRAADGDVLREGPVHEAFAKTIAERPQVPPPAKKDAPDPIKEVRPEIAPSLAEQSVWIPGYWSWDDSAEKFIWVSGVWRCPPPGHRWVPGRWVRTDEGPRRIEGFWYPRGVQRVALYPAPEYPANAVVTKEAPRGKFWVRGGLVIAEGKYQWREGFAAPEVRDWVWVPAHHVWTDQGWIYVDGYWDHPLKRRGQPFAALAFQNEDYAQPDFHLLAAYPVPLDSIEETEDGWTYLLDEDVNLAENVAVSFVPPAVGLAPPAVPAPPVAVVRGVARRGKLTVEGIVVRLEGSPIPPVETDAEGRFEFREVPYGEYTISAQGPVQNILRQDMALLQVAEPVVDKVVLELE